MTGGSFINIVIVFPPRPRCSQGSPSPLLGWSWGPMV